MTTTHTTARLRPVMDLARRTVFALAASAVVAFTLAACGPAGASPGEVADAHLDKNKPTATSVPR